jgi:hypothetical protein
MTTNHTKGLTSSNFISCGSGEIKYLKRNQMCNNCFDKGYKNFETLKEFEDFDILLTKKLSKGQLKYIKDDGVYPKFGYSIYQCSECGINWWLSIPDIAWRGFFLEEKNAIKLLDELGLEKSSRKIGCLLLFLIIACVTIYLIVN